MPEIHVTLLPGFDALDAELTAFAARLNFEIAESTDNDFFLTRAWFENLAEFGLESAGDQSASVQLLFAADSVSGYAACLPLLAHKKLSSLSNYYTGEYGLMRWQPKDEKAKKAISPAREVQERLTIALGQHLQKLFPTSPILFFLPLASDAPFTGFFESILKKSGYWTDRYFAFANWYLNVEGRTSETCFLSLPSPLRNSIERGKRRLAHTSWRLQIIQSGEPKLEAAIAHFVSVYEQSWKSPEPNPDFIPNLIRIAATNGWLRLGLLELDNQPIASQLWLVQNKKAFIFKLAFVKGYERFSPGSILTWTLMQHVIDTDKVTEVDYLSGDDPYKKDWMSNRRERYGIVAFSRFRLSGIWAACRHFANGLFRKKRHGIKILE